jgi:Flp pilus assembly protein TadG
MIRSRRHDSRGQALVEFALVVPIFVLVLLGLFDMGRAVLYYSTISNASREAVRLAIVDQDTADVRQAAISSASAVMRVSTTDITVDYLSANLSSGGDCSTPPHSIGCVVRVEVRHLFDPMIPFLGNINLAAETHQPIEREFVSP